MKKIIGILCFILCCTQLQAQVNQPDPHYNLIGQGSVQAKNYYLLTLFQQNSEVRHLLESDAVLSDLLKKKMISMNGLVADCPNYLCYTDGVKFNDGEIKVVSDRLAALYSPENALGKLVRTELIPSGTYVLYQNLPQRQILIKAWQIEATGINQVIGVYADGRKPGYPNIDSISFKVTSKEYNTQAYNSAATIVDLTKNDKLFFMPSLTAALLYLDLNERNDAANDEPMAETVNKAAIEKAKIVDWSKYKYTLILVPGEGPEENGIALSAGGMLRCRLAASRYFEGLAPFIMTSGGKVHPYKTKYCEADEMKKYLIETLHVPANAILVDPMARHTTTNMRNGVRLIYRYGFPFTKACITCTDKSQSAYIEKPMPDRCIKELGYVPYKLGARLSDTEQEFYPVLESLQINPVEPLDP